MGKLVEQSIKTLYQGVSRQPDPVRLPGQMEEADNILVSVVTGGFESRPSSRHITNLDFISTTDDPAVYAYSRDNAEQYTIIINNGTLKVFDLDGVEYTVNSPNGLSYIAGLTSQDVAFVTVADYTIISNRTKTVSMVPSTFVDPNQALITCKTTNANTKYEILIDGSVVFTKAAGAAVSATQIQDEIIASLSLPTGFTKAKMDQTVVITGDRAFTISHTGSDASFGPWTMREVIGKREYLPLAAPEGYHIRVGANVDGEEFGYWAEFDSNEGGWAESSDPYEDNEFDASTMPHWLIREADGTFTFSQGTYVERIAGDIETVPNPDFVDNKITSLVFHRNRLGFVSGETVFFSQAGKYFTFWRDFSTQSLDSDGFGLTVSSDTVNNLKHAIGFRKSLFLTSDKSQFEVSGANLLTPSTASVDLSTSYLTEEKCSPITLGNTLYFAAQSGRDAIVFEYQYDDASVSNVAQDITLHALGYIPAPITKMTGDPTNDMIMALCEREKNALYVYKMYVDGGSKAQSAWMRWTYGDDSEIKWMQVIDGELFLIINRGGTTCFEKTFLRYELAPEKHPYQVSMDRQTKVTGTYDPVTTLTTWTTPYPHLDLSRIVLSTDFPTGLVGEVLNVSYPTSNTITAFGDYTGGEAIIGQVFNSVVVMSRLYPRDPQNMRATITSGRFQVRNITFNFKETGYFQVTVTPEFRDPKTYSFTGRIIGSGNNRIGVPAIADLGGFRVPVMSKADGVVITVSNTSEKPFNITSVDYTGFFNEITRQG
ncbi:hypothetical protein N9778_00395 [Hyphomicrobiales bacterium]|nr:hypothetical protein [Hyphomicrobiales bacterium]